MTPRRFRAEQVVLACSLSLVCLAIAAARLLALPNSWLSRRLDRAVAWPVPR